jgi:dihydropteroate synthase
LTKLSKYKSLGVINRTPNSFSDHGTSLDPDFFTRQLQSFLDDPTVIIDIGFESTAPMNSAITHEEEKERFLDFLEASKSFDFQDRYISFDTYKPANFLFMCESFKRLHPKARFIFNDVSGVLDLELKEALLNFKGQNFYYIYTSAHIPSRDLVLQHMSFVKTEAIIEATASAFKNAHEWFKGIGMEKNLLLDPGFGFSKSYEDNWVLIDEFEELEEKISNFNILNPLVIGLSKKSFLRKKIETSELLTPEKLEELHLKLICDFLKNKKNQLLFRVHDPRIMNKISIT